MKPRIIVIGGLSAGPSAAAKARRQNENADILLFEKTKNISYATCGIPYAISGVINNRDKLLVVEAALLRERFQIDVHLEEEVVEILPEAHKVVTTKDVYTYDKLVFATGAKTVIPPIKNLPLATNWSPCRTLEDYDKIMTDEVLNHAKHFTVMGAGLIGLEVVENLIELGKKVTLIEGGDGILPMWDKKFRKFAQNIVEKHGVEVITNTFVTEFNVTNGHITSIPLAHKTISTDFVIMSVGIKPNTDLLLQKGAEHIGNGAVKVNERMETSLLDIYAAGDCASIKNLQTGDYDYLPLGTHSNKGGRAAGANAAGGNEVFKGGYKTAIVKVFDYTLARTGLNADFMRVNKIPFETNLIIAGATPGYYPKQKDIILETYYHPETGVVLGCEAFGEYGVDKRIDVMSTAIYGKLTIEDLTSLDLAYAPPFSPAKDPVVVAGYVSNNVFTGKFDEVSASKLAENMAQLASDECQIIDVRNPKELEKQGKIANALNFPLDQLRTVNLNMLDPNKPTYVYCAKGMRGYLASLILSEKGFNNVYNISGGFAVWKSLYKVQKIQNETQV